MSWDPQIWYNAAGTVLGQAAIVVFSLLGSAALWLIRRRRLKVAKASEEERRCPVKEFPEENPAPEDSEEKVRRAEQAETVLKEFEDGLNHGIYEIGKKTKLSKVALEAAIDELLRKELLAECSAASHIGLFELTPGGRAWLVKKA